MLWQLVGGLKVRFFHERSFRVSRGAIFPNRFLLTINKDDVGENRQQTMARLWRRMGMPEDFLSIAGRLLAAAQFLHFGYEENKSSSLYKVYLEMGVPADLASARSPILLHVAFKWDPAETSRAALSRYFFYPGLSAGEMVERISRIYAHEGECEPFEIACGILLLSERRIVHGSSRYLQVTEDNNQRKSFDVNLYDAKLKMEDLSPFFARMCDHYSIPAERFEAMFGPYNTKPIGHLAGGIHRGGEDFFNAYYGVEERQGLGEDVMA